MYPDPTEETTGLDSGYQKFFTPLSERKCLKKSLRIGGRDGKGKEREGWENSFVGNIHIYFSSLFPLSGHVLNSF